MRRRSSALLLLAAASVALADDLPAGPFLREGDGAVELRARAGQPLVLVRTEGGVAQAGRAPRTEGGWLDVRWREGEGIDSLGTARADARTASAILDPLHDASGATIGLSGFHVAPGGERRHEVHRLRGAQGDLAPSGFRRHLHEAIAINSARRDDYERRSGGRSRSLSRRLILLERVTIAWAWWHDWRGRRWNKRGVPIVAADFVAMRVADPARPPRWRGRMTDAQREQLSARLAAASVDIKRLLDASRWEDCAARCVALLGEVEAFESGWGCHLAMTRHVVEQVGWSSLNAATWSRQSGGETDTMARQFCRGLRLAFGSAPDLDARAQQAHEVGVGVLVNDLPEIPLAAALAGLRAAR